MAESAFTFELAEVVVVCVQYFVEGCVSHSCQYFPDVLLHVLVDCVSAVSLRVLLSVLPVVVDWRFLSLVFVAQGAVGRLCAVSYCAHSTGQGS